MRRSVTLAALLTACFAASAFAQSSATRNPAGADTLVDAHTWVENDRRPIIEPPEWEPDYWKTQFRRGIVDPLSHLLDIPDKLIWMAGLFGAETERQAANVNALDEVPNTTWFTNRNHLRAVSPAELRRGPYPRKPPVTPWTLKDAKRGGVTTGFQIEDADGEKWLVKLDPRGYPQLSSGADMIARTLLHAAGYNVPNNQPIRFAREDLKIDPELERGAKGKAFTAADLETLLTLAATADDGRYSGFASHFLDGVLGAPSMDRTRPGDTNDWYEPENRRELRGLFVLASWLNDWDKKDQQFLDTFVETNGERGHVRHYILDAGASFGAGGQGPKNEWAGYEHAFDLEWTGIRIVTLGFAQEPWRSARQETGIPSVGNYESAVYEPEDFKTYVSHPAFRKMTERDGYWGAKIVASFSDEQIAAAVDAARYEDPRARDYIVQNLIVRRDKIARHWFERIAPLDFFHVDGGVLRFHDLAVEMGLAPSRAYEIEIDASPSGTRRRERLRVHATEVAIDDLAENATRLTLELSIPGTNARPAEVELTRENDRWTVTRVRHG